MRFVNISSIVVLGFFPLCFQSLIFRDFLTAFDGNELSLGIFLFFWLFWVAVGAIAARLCHWKWFSRHFDLLLLGYIPTAILQKSLFVFIRQIINVQAYEVIPLTKLTIALVLINAPVSCLSGFLFFKACKVIEDDVLPISKVYAFEALGSFLGAVSVTLLLYHHVDQEMLFLLNILAVISAVACRQIFFIRLLKQKLPVSTAKAFLNLLLLVVTSYFITGGFCQQWTRWQNKKEWYYLLPKGDYQGTFVTYNSRYHYGEFASSFVVVSWNSVVETFPDTNASLQNVALNLVQNPDAKRVMVIGQGVLGECVEFANLDSIEEVVWLDADPQYPENIKQLIVRKDGFFPDKITLPDSDIRNFLDQNIKPFDIIVVNFPEPETLLMNRFFSQEFFAKLAQSVSDNGVISFAVPGGENFIGSELAFIGASIYVSLKKQFDHVILKPGETSILFASPRRKLVDSEKGITANYSRMRDLKDYYPVEPIIASFQKERIDYQMDIYDALIKKMPESMLLNTDRSPKSFLFSLLYNLKKTDVKGLSVNQLTGFIAYTDFSVYVIIFFFYCCRLMMVLGWKKCSSVVRPSCLNVDLFCLMFTISALAMLVNIIIMMAYQIRFGAIFIKFGLISSLFMVGLFLGSVIVRRFVSTARLRSGIVAALMAFIVFCISVFGVLYANYEIVFVISFVAAGLLSGLFLPAIASLLKTNNVNQDSYIMNLEILDHLGGGIGCLLASLVMIPVFGIAKTLYIVIIILSLEIIIRTIFNHRRGKAL